MFKAFGLKEEIIVAVSYGAFTLCGREIFPLSLSSHTIGLGLIRALGQMGVPIIVVYYNKHDMGYVSKYVKKKIYASHPEKYEKEFLMF